TRSCSTIPRRSTPRSIPRYATRCAPTSRPSCPSPAATRTTRSRPRRSRREALARLPLVHLHPQLRHLVAQRVARQAELLRGAAEPAAGARERPRNQPLLESARRRMEAALGRRRLLQHLGGRLRRLAALGREELPADLGLAQDARRQVAQPDQLVVLEDG